MADIAKVNTEVSKTGIVGAQCSNVDKGAGQERASFVAIKHGRTTFEIGYWDERENRARTDDEIAAIAKTLCGTLVAKTGTEGTTK